VAVAVSIPSQDLPLAQQAVLEAGETARLLLLPRFAPLKASTALQTPEVVVVVEVPTTVSTPTCLTLGRATELNSAPQVVTVGLEW
jgi:hypothetical protein